MVLLNLLQPLPEYFPSKGRIVSQHRQFTMDNVEACVKTASPYIRPTPRPSNTLSATYANKCI